MLSYKSWIRSRLILIIIPQHVSRCTQMYGYGPVFIDFVDCEGDQAGCLMLAGGQVLVGLHPLHQGHLAVANGAPNLDKGRPVTPHAGLS
jgi:hypothetical protein